MHALHGQGDHVGAPGFDLDDVGDALFEQRLVGAQRHHQPSRPQLVTKLSLRAPATLPSTIPNT